MPEVAVYQLTLPDDLARSGIDGEQGSAGGHEQHVAIEVCIHRPAHVRGRKRPARRAAARVEARTVPTENEIITCPPLVTAGETIG